MRKRLFTTVIVASLMSAVFLAGCGDDTPKEETVDVSSSEEMDEEEEQSLSEMFDGILTVGYVGAGEDDAEIYWAMDDDVTKGVFVYAPKDSELISYVGDILHDEGDDVFTITDDQTGDSYSFSVEISTDDDGDDVYTLSNDDGVIGVLYEAPVSEVLDAIEALDK